MLIVGEIGIQPDAFWRLAWWEVRSIIRGYNRRHRQMWSAVRWHAYNVMSAIPYCDLRKNNINRPKDLIEFPWDAISDDDGPTDEEVREMEAEIAALNAMNDGDAATDNETTKNQ